MDGEPLLLSRCLGEWGALDRRCVLATGSDSSDRSHATAPSAVRSLKWALSLVVVRRTDRCEVRAACPVGASAHVLKRLCAWAGCVRVITIRGNWCASGCSCVTPTSVRSWQMWPLWTVEGA